MTSDTFDQLNHRHLGDIEAYARQLTRDRNEAKDLVQESLYRIYKYRHRFEEGTNFRAWALRVVRNVFVSNFRKNKYRETLLREKPANLGWSNRKISHNPAEGSMGAEQLIALIEQLPVKYQHPFLLRYQGVPYKTIAARMGTPVGTVKSRVFTARAILRVQVRKLYRVPG